jgi:tetratricopeptide (TPR) repeat protein
VAPPQREPDSPPELSFADVIGGFIDAEGRGDTATLTALDLVSRITSSALGDVRVLAVIVPRFGLPWEREDLLFVRFLAQALTGETQRVVLVWTGPEEPSLPADWTVSWTEEHPEAPSQVRPSLAGLIPGVLDDDALAALSLVEPVAPGACLPLPRGHLLVAPESRRDPRLVSRFDYDKLALVTRPAGRLHTYALFHGNNFYVDPWALWAQARQELEGGGYGVALRLAARAQECARDPMQLGVLQSLAQGIRIASQRFAEAAASPDPSPAVPDGLRSFLLQAKGWALVMSDDPVGAEPYFQGAHALLDRGQRADREYLYLLNIWALNRFKLDDLEGALALEREIEARHARLPRRDWRLEYVNSINIARICRRQGAYETAEHYYLGAFATTQGARTEGDGLYTNVCFARLNEAWGRSAEPFAHWMRAALHWVSSSVPEALGSRVATTIVSRKVAPDKPDPEEVSEAIESALAASARAAGLAEAAAAIEAANRSGEPPVFVRADRFAEDLEPGAVDCAVLGSGWSVLSSRMPSPVQLQSPRYRRLRSTLLDLIRLDCPGDLLRGAITFIVDDSCGTEMPTTLRELVELSLRRRLRSLVVNGKLLEINDETRARLERKLRVRIGHAVEGVRRKGPEVWVTFKRYLAPRLLSDQEARILERLNVPVVVDELGEQLFGGDVARAHFLPLLRSMERSRLVNLEVPGELVKQAPLRFDAGLGRETRDVTAP